MDIQEKAIIWLTECTDFDYRSRVALLRRAGTPEKLFSVPDSFFDPYRTERRAKSFGTRTSREEAAEKAIARMGKEGCFAITLLSDDYPQKLAEIFDPPILLYGKGRRELLQSRKFAIVGSRIIPPHAERQAQEIASELSERFTIVTGLAEGGDTAAIQGAFPNVISVLPNGMDECYPAAHASLKRKIAESGLLLTECRFGEKVKKYSFQARNRILAGLSDGVFVVSAGKKSGTLITANRALEYGRDVFAFPYNVGVEKGEGCNDLIKKGAALVTSAEDILFSYGMQAAKKKETALSEEEENLLSVLKEYGELHMAVLAERAHLKVFEAAAFLSSLELKGLIVKAGGNRYQIV